jgi:hypothetical protein
VPRCELARVHAAESVGAQFANLRPTIPLTDYQHGGSRQPSLPQIGKRPVGLAQRITRRFGVERNLGGQTHERKSVFAREIGHRHHAPLAP